MTDTNTMSVRQLQRHLARATNGAARSNGQAADHLYAHEPTTDERWAKLPPEERDMERREQNERTRQALQGQRKQRENRHSEPQSTQHPPHVPLEIRSQLSDNISPRSWLLGTTFCRKVVSGLFAPGGVGKTALRVAQAIALASGTRITGEYVHQQSRVLYVSLEDDIEEIERRIWACLKRHDLAYPEGYLFYCAPGSQSGKLLLAMGRKRVEAGLAKHIADAIRARNIDVIILDPFKKAHGVDENDNTAMDEVVSLVAGIAIKHNMSMDLVHHTSKGAMEAGNADKGRGASAVKDGARLVKTLAMMTPEEAKAFDVSEQERRSLVRYDTGKENTAPASDAKWFKLVSVQLDNATNAYPNGDSVQTVETWTPPDAWEGMNTIITNQILDRIDAGLADGERYSDSPTATTRAAWRIVADATGKDQGPCREIIRAWLKSGLLVKETYDSPTRRETQVGVRVDHTKRPT